MGVGRHLAAWVAWWIALFWLWMLLVGDWNRIEWIGGACVATVAASLAERLRAAAGVRPRVAPHLLSSALIVPAIVLADFGILLWALGVSLVRRRVVRGSFRARAFDPRGDDPAGVAHRAWTVLLAGYSPNAYVVDLDPETQQVILHDLVPHRASEEPI